MNFVVYLSVLLVLFDIVEEKASTKVRTVVSGDTVVLP